jgi:hypothetical protein
MNLICSRDILVLVKKIREFDGEFSENLKVHGIYRNKFEFERGMLNENCFMAQQYTGIMKI